jgi:hypothetical protein
MTLLRAFDLLSLLLLALSAGMAGGSEGTMRPPSSSPSLIGMAETSGGEDDGDGASGAAAS